MANRSSAITTTTTLYGSSSAENLSDYTISPNDSSSDSSLVAPPSQSLTETRVGALVADQDLDVADLVPDVAGDDGGSSTLVIGGEGSGESEDGDHIDRDGDEDLGDGYYDNDGYDDVEEELDRIWSSSLQRLIKMQTRQPKEPTRKRCPYCGAKPGAGCVHNKDRLGYKFRP
ncbi:unnamed protein product [Microthlaspi erraticum]|uniref:Uncharacterized protein n=1 Tax=Microthlaspi erraticum TaxID=1685480 RepID=A0A6D2HDP1_9BRAS|nr:unnamed protein product [Microthlaspi erraticum]